MQKCTYGVDETLYLGERSGERRQLIVSENVLQSHRNDCITYAVFGADCDLPVGVNLRETERKMRGLERQFVVRDPIILFLYNPLSMACNSHLSAIRHILEHF